MYQNDVFMELPNGLSKRGDLLVFRQFDSSVIRSKSVTSPSAQTTRLCEPYTDNSKELDLRMASLLADNINDKRLCSVVLLLFESGLRVSEVLNINGNDITKDLRVKIKGLKGSNNKIIKLNDNYGFWSMLQGNNLSIKDDLNRFYLYRKFKQYGLSAVYGSNKKSSVTHLPRHELALDVYSSSEDIEDVKNCLGHKNVNSSEWYVGKGRL